MASEVIESEANFLDEYHDALSKFSSLVVTLHKLHDFVQYFYWVAVNVKMSVMLV